MTSLTVDEFQPVVPPFEAAFQSHMAPWRLDGKPRTARRYTTDQNCPLPTPEARLLFLLVYLKTSPLQVVQGRLFGMGQSQAHQWMHVLLVVLRATRRTLGDAPTRSLTALANRLGVTEADASALVVPTEDPPRTSGPPAAAPASAPASPLVGTTEPRGASSVPRIQLSRRAVIAARTRATPSKTSCGSMRHSRASCAVRPRPAAPTISGWRMPPHTPCLQAADDSRISAFGRVRFRRSR